MVSFKPTQPHGEREQTNNVINKQSHGLECKFSRDFSAKLYNKQAIRVILLTSLTGT